MTPVRHAPGIKTVANKIAFLCIDFGESIPSEVMKVSEGYGRKSPHIPSV